MSRDDDTPARIGKYRVLGPLGEGGMSVVYRARDEALDRLVALKVLHRHLARDPEARARFTREARAVARLTHRNIPEVYDFSGSSGGDDTRAYIVSEIVEGASLARILRPDAATPKVLPELGVAIALGVGQALAHAHKHQVIHRDVKPENVLVGKDGVAKLTDFGIAQVRGLESMTMTGTLIGSPAHMAPEQIDGTKDLDARVDVWGFGTVLYMVATGRLPFEADNPHHLLRKVVAGDYVDPRRASPHVDAELAAIIRRCLTVERAGRYASIEAVLADLQRWYDGRRLAAPEVEVQGYMADPDGYAQLLIERLVTIDLRLGDEALTKGQAAVALERFGRVLALDPDSDVALERINSIERRRRRKKAALVSASGLFVAGAGTLVVLLALKPGPTPATRDGAMLAGLDDAPTKPSLVAPVVVEPVPEQIVPVVVTAGEALGDALALVALPPPPKIDGRKDPRDDKGNEAARDGIQVSLTVNPAPVRVTIDKNEVSPPVSVSLKPGKKYRVKLEHTTCSECGVDFQELTVPLDATSGFKHHFEYRRKLAPARVLLKCGREGYALDNKGRRYKCDAETVVQVDSTELETVMLNAFLPDGTRFGAPISFTIGPKKFIQWDL